MEVDQPPPAADLGPNPIDLHQPRAPVAEPRRQRRWIVAFAVGTIE